MAGKSVIIGREIIFLGDFDAEADILAESDGITNVYSFGEPGMDDYMGGGYGKRQDHEIVLVFGDTGIGKSTFSLNMVADPIKRGKKVGLLMLEDSGQSVNLKMRKIIGRDVLDRHRQNIHFTPDDVVSGKKLWGLDDLLVLIDQWFNERGLDVILLDHLQFAFESAMSVRGENEYAAQRMFVRSLNYIIRKHNKTIILVSHISKNNSAHGLGKIIGSGGIAGAVTKAIEVYRDKDIEGQMHVRLWKTRHTPHRHHDRVFAFDDKQHVIAWAAEFDRRRAAAKPGVKF